jgi:hypothetical protein
MRDIARVPGDEIVYADDLVPFREETVTEVRTEKTSSPGDQ